MFVYVCVSEREREREREREILEKRGREGLNNTYLWEEREFY